MKMNCWEFRMCGREVGGRNVEKMGVCLAVLDDKHNGINGGQNGGRYCWSAVGTMSGGKPEYCISQNIKDCHECHFYQLVKAQENKTFMP